MRKRVYDYRPNFNYKDRYEYSYQHNYHIGINAKLNMNTSISKDVNRHTEKYNMHRTMSAKTIHR